MKILVVCQHFYPENFRINDECFELVKRGHDVTVLTGLPNYPEGKVLDEYKHGRKREQIVNGVKIRRCFLVGRGQNILCMALNYLCFAIMGCLKAASLKEQYDVVYAYQLSPITMVWPGITVKRKQHVPLVIHCLDQWPISVSTGPVSKSSIIYKLLHKISVWTYKKADTITISSKSFKDYFEETLNISAGEKGLIYLPSYAESTYKNVGIEKNDSFDIVFAGNIGPAQNCETIVECANCLKGERTIKFHMVGDGLNYQNCIELANKYGLDNVRFYGYHPIDKMPDFYKMADCFIITMQDNEVVNSTLPAKIQSYMLAGKPIFGAISGEVKQVVNEAACGICVESGDYKALANAIANNYKDDTKLSKWGANGLKYYEAHFEKEKCLDDREAVFRLTINER